MPIGIQLPSRTTRKKENTKVVSIFGGKGDPGQALDILNMSITGKCYEKSVIDTAARLSGTPSRTPSGLQGGAIAAGECPKPDGGTRPLGVKAIESKIVQNVAAWLNARAMEDGRWRDVLPERRMVR